MKKNKIIKPKIFKTQKFSNINGTLIPIYVNKINNFKTKRIFIIKGNKGQIRGNHAHKECTQIFVPLTGQSSISIKKVKNYNFTLSEEHKEILVVPPLHWCTIKFKKNKSSFLVLCDVDYSTKEYIRDFKKFKKALGK